MILYNHYLTCVRISKTSGVKTSTEFCVQCKPKVLGPFIFSQFKIIGVNVV